jgi:L-ascorbate metabolism protein UlaG (beta-lactamase superfamily)
MKRRTVASLLSASAVLTLGGVGYARKVRSRNPYYQGPVSDHFDGVRFFNPGKKQDRGPAELMRWQLGGGREPWPDTYPSPFPPAKPDERVDGLRVTHVGHASLLIQVSGLNILIDPVWSKRASPVRFAGPARANPPGIVFEDLPPIDVVLVTHNHYDHLDTRTLSRLWRAHEPRIIAPLGNDAVVAGADPSVPVETFDWGRAVTLSDGITAHLEPANHWSARGLNDRRMALWCAYVLTTPAGVIYHVGDTGYGDGAIFRRVRECFGAPRLAILPIGAYEPRWFMAPQHMNPEESVRAFEDTGAEQALGHHWGTFRLTNEAVDHPVRDLAAALEARAMPAERFPPLHPGEVWDAPSPGT